MGLPIDTWGVDSNRTNKPIGELLA